MAIRATVNLTKVNASVTSEVLQAGVHYTLHNATGIWVDPDSKNRFFNEEVPLADIHFTLLEKNLSDNITLPDAPEVHPILNKTETLSLLETFVNVIAYNRSFNDAFTLDDASLIDKDYYGNKGNVTFILDVVGLSQEKILADSYTVGDVFKNVVTFIRTFGDSVAFNDANYFNLSKGVNDSTGLLVDVLGVDYNKPLNTDTVVMDSLTAVGTALNKFDVNMGITDANVILTNKNPSDSFSFSDSYTRVLNKVLTDAFTLDDASLVDKNYYGNKGNTLSFTEVVTLAVEFKRSFSHSTTLSDALEFVTGKKLNDPVGFTEILATSLGKPLTESTTINDVLSLAQYKNNSDDIAVGDSLVTLTGKQIDNDLFTMSDVYGLQLQKSLSDGFALDDAALVDKNYYGNKGNIVGLNDLLTISHIESKLLGNKILNKMTLN